MLYIARHFISSAVRNHVRKYVTAGTDAPINLTPILMKTTVFEDNNTDKTKPPLLILHGLFGSRARWVSVAQALQAETHRKVITMDARNHGESPKTESHGFLQMSADLLHLMQQMNINKAALMGHSMGGIVMMYMTLKHPDLVERAAIVDMSPTVTKYFASMESILRAMKQVQVPEQLPISDGRKYAKNEISKSVKAKKTVDFIMSNLKKETDGQYEWNLNINSVYASIRSFEQFVGTMSGLPPYTGPVMFICSIKSKFVRQETVPEIKKIYPNCQIQWVDTGHMVHFEQPAKLVNLLTDFLK